MNENSSIVKFQPDQQQIDTIKSTICRDATQPELEMFLEVCKGTGLNPFLNEIWFIKMAITIWDEKTKQRKDTGEFKINIFAARDGYLKIANNHPQYDGMEHEEIKDEKTKAPTFTTVTVYRKDRSHPASFTAPFSEYWKDTPAWKKNPSAMLLKVAEAGALKRAFAVSGLLTLEEVGANSIKEAQEILSKEPIKGQAEQTERATVKECEEATKRMKWADITVVLDKYKVSSLRELPRQAVLDMIAGLKPEPVVIEAEAEMIDDKTEAAKPQTGPAAGSEAEPNAAHASAIKPAAPAPGNNNGGFETPEKENASVSPSPAQAAQPAGAPKTSGKADKADNFHYTCEPNKILNKWNVYKYDAGNHILATYHVERDLSACDCPSRKKPCKHQQFVSAYKQSDEYSEKYGIQRVHDKMNDKEKYAEIRKSKGYEIAVSEFLKDKFAMGLAVIFDYMVKKMNAGTTAGLKPAHWQLIYECMFDLSQDEIDKVVGFKNPGAANV